MKYKLKRDLPFARMGTEILLLFSNVNVVQCYIHEKDGLTFKVKDNDMVELLIENGWIEEVKPREFYVELYKDSLRPSDVSDERTYLREDARFTTIKVREVIE